MRTRIVGSPVSFVKWIFNRCGFASRDLCLLPLASHESPAVADARPFFPFVVARRSLGLKLPVTWKIAFLPPQMPCNARLYEASSSSSDVSAAIEVDDRITGQSAQEALNETPAAPCV